MSLRVVDALIGGDERLARLYQNSPEFHEGVRLISRAVPVFMQALAEAAEESASRRVAAEEMLRSMMPGPVGK